MLHVEPCLGSWCKAYFRFVAFYKSSSNIWQLLGLLCKKCFLTKKTALASFWTKFGANWVTIYSNIWSHCMDRPRITLNCNFFDYFVWYRFTHASTFSFLLFLAHYWNGAKYFYQGSQIESNCIPGTSTDYDFTHKLQQKKVKKPLFRADDGEAAFDFSEVKSGPSLLNQLLPGQVFDPRQIDFSALMLPNSHRSGKSGKKRRSSTKDDWDELNYCWK